MKTIYFIRHSKTENYKLKLFDRIKYKDSKYIKNKKSHLSEEGIMIAQKKFENHEFDNIEAIYSSNYTRAIETARILAKKNNLEVVIEPNFRERKIGEYAAGEDAVSFEIYQFNDNNYKLQNGESLNEVRLREEKSLSDILNNCRLNNIAIVFHSTAMMILLKKWCEVSYDSNYVFRNKEFFDGKWNYCETFKLIFDEKNELYSIENIK